MPNLMAAQLNTGGTLCESSVIPFIVPCHEVGLTTAARLPCSNAGNIQNARVGRKVNFADGKIPLGGKSPRPKKKCIYSVPAQETANIFHSFVALH